MLSAVRRRRTAARLSRVYRMNWWGVMPTKARKLRRKWYGHRRLVRQIGERQRLVGLRFDPTQRGGNLPLVTAARRRRPSLRSRQHRCDRAGETQRHFLESRRVTILARGFGGGDDGQQSRVRWQQRCGEDGSPHAGDCGYDSFEKFGREAERETAVAGAVLMAAFERVAIIAEEQRPRRQHGRAQRRAF